MSRLIIYHVLLIFSGWEGLGPHPSVLGVVPGSVLGVLGTASAVVTGPSGVGIGIHESLLKICVQPTELSLSLCSDFSFGLRSSI